MRQIAKVLAGAVVMLAALTATTSPALAHPIDYRNWGDNHTLCQSCRVDKGNIVALWQAILWVDNELHRCIGGIDGFFGPITRNSTERWQARYWLKVDGIVGPKTWNTADIYIRKFRGGPNPLYYYWGVEDFIFLRVRDNHNMIWKPPQFGISGPFYDTGHPQISHQCG